MYVCDIGQISVSLQASLIYQIENKVDSLLMV